MRRWLILWSWLSVFNNAKRTLNKINFLIIEFYFDQIFDFPVIASGFTTFAYLIYALIYKLIIDNSSQKNSITIQIDYYNLGPYNDWNKNIIYESLLWLISDQTKKLYEGIFILNVLPNLNNKNKKYNSWLKYITNK